MCVRVGLALGKRLFATWQRSANRAHGIPKNLGRKWGLGCSRLCCSSVASRLYMRQRRVSVGVQGGKALPTARTASPNFSAANGV